MKKIIIFSLLFILTGCVSNKDFNKVCNYEHKTTHIDDMTTIDVKYNSEDILNEATVIHSYKALDDDGKKVLANIKEANNTYNTKYSSYDILVYVSKDSEDEYEIKYKLDVQKIDDDILKEFKLRKNSIKFFKIMNKENIECEVKR